MLDTVTKPIPALAPPRRWTDDDDFEAMSMHHMRMSDAVIGDRIGRSAKAVHHRRHRLLLAASKPGHAPTPVGSALDRAERGYLDAQAACDRAHDAYHDAMRPYLRPVAEALRRAGLVTDGDVSADTDEGEAAWRVVEALRRCGVEIRVPS